MQFNHIDYQAKQDARKFAANALKQAFPHLVPVSEKTNSLVAAAKNVRIELAKAFPGIKFSVKTSRFSGGDSLRVSWTDGPTCNQVNEIAKQYEAGDFDGMTDSYNYRKDHAWPDVFGDAKYVSCDRDYSPELVQIAIDYVWERYQPEAAKISTDDFFNGNARCIDVVKGGYPGDRDASVQIYRFLSKYDGIAKALTEEFTY